MEKPISDIEEINTQVDSIMAEQDFESYEESLPTSDTEIIDVEPIEDNSQVEVVEDINEVAEVDTTGLTYEELSDAVEIGVE